ncbi:hypothetical protein BX600DRAFT_511783 [Xylariales sp. PMI_506]|nr:hypothetical protein BX600DRAFT_511783 [Xylariales sp. PMI_506]
MRVSHLVAFSFANFIYAATCPEGDSEVSINGDTICCPGILSANGDLSDADCLVGCSLSYASCFPFCTGDGNSPTTVGDCTTVPVTASDYTSLVYSGATPTATTTAASAQATESGASATSTTSESTSTKSSPGVTSTTKTAVAPYVTQAPVLALAGAIMGVLLA